MSIHETTIELVEMFMLESIMHTLDSCNGSLHISGNTIVFSMNGQAISSTKVPAAAISLAQKGCLGDNSIASIGESISAMVTKASTVSINPIGVEHVIDSLYSAGSKMSKDTPVIDFGKSCEPGLVNDSNAGLPPVAIKIAQPSKVMTESPVKLNAATKLYQPVKGSSQGSIYFCVGITLDNSLKIGARIKSDFSVSVRVEGDVLNHKSAIEGAGITVQNEHYGSVHLSSGGSPIMAGRIIGSLLAGIGLDYRTQVPKVSYLMGKGV